MSIRVVSLVWERSRHRGAVLLQLLAMADHARDSGNGIRAGRKLLRAKTRVKSARTVDANMKVLLSSGELVKVRKGGNGLGDTNVYRIDVELLLSQPYAMDREEDGDEGGEVADSAPFGEVAIRGEVATQVATAIAPETLLDPGGVGYEIREEEKGPPAQKIGWLEGAFRRMESIALTETERIILADRKLVGNEMYRDAVLAFHRAYPEARYDRELWVGVRGTNIERFIRAWNGDGKLLARAVALAREARARDPIFAPRAPAGMVTFLDAARLERDAPPPIPGAPPVRGTPSAVPLDPGQREDLERTPGARTYAEVYPGQYIADQNLRLLGTVKFPGLFRTVAQQWPGKAIDIAEMITLYRSKLREAIGVVEA